MGPSPARQYLLALSLISHCPQFGHTLRMEVRIRRHGNLLNSKFIREIQLENTVRVHLFQVHSRVLQVPQLANLLRNLLFFVFAPLGWSKEHTFVNVYLYLSSLHVSPYRGEEEFLARGCYHKTSLRWYSGGVWYRYTMFPIPLEKGPLRLLD